MKKRIRLRKRNKKRKQNLLIITLISVLITVIFLINMINEKITPILLETAEFEINKLSTFVINKTITEVLEEKINTDKLFNTIINDSGDIQTIDFNPIVVNEVLNIATTIIQNNLTLLEEGELDTLGIYDMNLSEDRINDLKKGVITKIPIGVVTENSILANLGPSIPIRLHYTGDVNSNITTKITQYGINNALVEIGVKLEITAQIILPFITEKKILEFNLPLAIKMIQGNIPNYYGSGIVRDSSLYTTQLE